MTVSTTDVRETKVGDGVTVEWSFAYVALDPSHIKVKIRDAVTGAITALVYNTDFSVALTGTARPAAGAITLLGAYASTPPDSNDRVEIYRVTPRTQTTPLDPRTGFASGNPEAIFDKYILCMQEALDALDNRVLRLADGDSPAALDAIADAVSRAGLLLGFDASGQPETAIESSKVSAAMAPVIAAATLAAATALLAAAGEAQLGVAEIATLAEAKALDATRIVPADKIASWLGSALEPGGRLTLATGTPVTTSDQSAKTTLYYALYKHALVPLYTGTLWVVKEIAELSLALDSDSGHTGYHQSGKNFNAYLDYNGGTPRLVTSPAWYSDTEMLNGDATGLVERVGGRWVNKGAQTVRFGTGSGDTATLAANTGLWLGTFRATANGQTEDSLAKRFVWNTYNRVERPMLVFEPTDTWTYTTLTFRQANANTANQLDCVFGLSEDPVDVEICGTASNDNIGIQFWIGVGLSSTSTIDENTRVSGIYVSAVANVQIPITARWRGFPGIGRRYFSWNERSVATGTTTWRGDGGSNSTKGGIRGRVMA